ncbi:hypothetical protein BBJ28_00022042 [Nothophytophthora sp. Chile5]|nr:hypothetical protein BBJ28_00022042 [Nothophytophthora sp. Chile5]
MSSPISGSGARTNSSGDTCAYYGLEPGESCGQPRSCYDCLNVPVVNDPEGCLLSQFGVCESMTDYDGSLDYRSSGSSADSGSATNFTGGWYHMFPAVNTTYCEASDAACVKCNALARNYSTEGNYIAMTTKFCVGATGCVCILSCEESVWKLRTVTDCEDLPVDSTASSAASTTSVPLTASPTGITTDSSSTGSSKNLFWLFAIPLVMLVFYGHYVRLQGKAR